MSDETLILRVIWPWKLGMNTYKARWKSQLWKWPVNRRTRKQLRGLEQDQLKDIGISSSEALEEARKPFWID